MARAYTFNPVRRFLNSFVMRLIPFGILSQKWHILTVYGRKSGKAYQLPVSIIEQAGNRYLVSPYGEPNWVKNARASGEVTLKRKTEETLRIREISPTEAASILKHYLQQEPITRPYFEVTPEAPLAEFEAEAPKHPVFELT